VMDWACGEGCKRYIALSMGSIPHLALAFAHLKIQSDLGESQNSVLALKC
jgi:hypothetical protein